MAALKYTADFKRFTSFSINNSYYVLERIFSFMTTGNGGNTAGGGPVGSGGEDAAFLVRSV